METDREKWKRMSDWEKWNIILKDVIVAGWRMQLSSWEWIWHNTGGRFTYWLRGKYWEEW